MTDIRTGDTSTDHALVHGIDLGIDLDHALLLAQKGIAVHQ